MCPWQWTYWTEEHLVPLLATPLVIRRAQLGYTKVTPEEQQLTTKEILLLLPGAHYSPSDYCHSWQFPYVFSISVFWCSSQYHQPAASGPATNPFHMLHPCHQHHGCRWETHWGEHLIPIPLKIRLHYEELISFHGISTPKNPIILDHLWLITHNPLMSWTHKDILKWSSHCHTQCLLTTVMLTCMSPHLDHVNIPDAPTIPKEYTDFMEVFSKIKASQLPSHRPWDCAIDSYSTLHHPGVKYIHFRYQRLRQWKPTLRNH